MTDADDRREVENLVRPENRDWLHENMIRDRRRRLAPGHWSNEDIDCLLGRLDKAKAAHLRRIDDLLAANNALLDRARAAEEQLRWRPIETAPKDGTEIDVWRTFSGLRTHDDPRPNKTTGIRTANARWEEGAWIDCSGDPIEWGPDEFGQSCRVTHWLPLPEPPHD